MTSSNSREMKQKLSGFKTEVANSMNISLNQGYNGDISARDARMIEYAERNMNGGSNMMK